MSARELVTSSSVGGRRLTLDPLLPTTLLPVEPRRVESTISCGFRQAWIDGTDEEGLSFALSVGAGLGSKWLTLEVTMPDGTTRHEAVDMAEVAQAWVDKVVSEGPTPEVTT